MTKTDQVIEILRTEPSAAMLPARALAERVGCSTELAARAIRISGLASDRVRWKNGRTSKRSKHCRRKDIAASSGQHVYFIQQGEDGPVKIGVAKLVGERVNRLQAGNPDQLHLRAMIHDGGRKLEAELHERFAASRVRGEWFAVTPELQAMMDAHRVHRPFELN